MPVAEIETRVPSNVSMMPDDLLKPHSETEVRALIAYLRNPTQVPILATPENAKDLFNGKDLTGWTATRRCGPSTTARSSARAPASRRTSS